MCKTRLLEKNVVSSETMWGTVEPSPSWDEKLTFAPWEVLAKQLLAHYLLPPGAQAMCSQRWRSPDG